MNVINILIVDDHLVVREGLKGMLSSQPDLCVIGESADGVDAVQKIIELRPNVVLMDLRMPGGDGVTAIRHLRERGMKTQILILTTWDTDGDIVRAIEAGATGYLLKDTPRLQLFKAIRQVANGKSVLAPAVAERLHHQSKPTTQRLSGRELQVLQLVATGRSNKMIGRELHISEATVKTHLVHIYNKLNVKDRASAVSLGYQRGLLQLD